MKTFVLRTLAIFATLALLAAACGGTTAAPAQPVAAATVPDPPLAEVRLDYATYAPTSLVLKKRGCEALGLWTHPANGGDPKSLVSHPASTTHQQLSDDKLAAAGVGSGSIRLSVGLETLDDLLGDLSRGLAAALEGA